MLNSSSQQMAGTAKIQKLRLGTNSSLFETPWVRIHPFIVWKFASRTNRCLFHSLCSTSIYRILEVLLVFSTNETIPGGAVRYVAYYLPRMLLAK